MKQRVCFKHTLHLALLKLYNYLTGWMEHSDLPLDAAAGENVGLLPVQLQCRPRQSVKIFPNVLEKRKWLSNS